MAKTIVVRVERRFPHPKFKKVVTGYSKFYAHDEKAEAKIGDVVLIEEISARFLEAQALAVDESIGQLQQRRDAGCGLSDFICCKFVLIWMSRTTRARKWPGRSACSAGTSAMPVSATSLKAHIKRSRAGWHGEKGRSCRCRDCAHAADYPPQ